MSLEVRPAGRPPRDPARLLALSFARLGLLSRLLLGLLAAAGTAAVVYLAMRFYPDRAPPPPSEVEQRAAALFGLPLVADGTIEGDFLVERFYAIDVESGERYVGDMLKGRIQSIQSLGPEGDGPYLALLDLRNLQRDRAFYAAFVDAVARPQGNYLGLRAFGGADDAFRLNYDGFIPEHRLAFTGPSGENVYDFLLAQKYDEIARAPRLIRNEGHNYVLNTTEMFPYFRTEFRTGRAILLSELIIVDATSRSQRATFLRLQEQFKVTPTSR
jgi:hypothetical protein